MLGSRALVTLSLAAAAALVAIGSVSAQETPKPGERDGSTHATGERQGHPLYDDKGAIDWRERWADAARLAKARNKLVFIEMGRES